MAKLEAVVDANISPFQKALKLAIGDAEKFGEKMGDVGSDLLKGLSGIDLSKALGIGIAIYGAQKLGDALVDAAKEGLEAFSKYQDAVLRFKYTLPTAPGQGAFAAGRAAETAETAESKAGIYSAEQLQAAALALMQASKELRESPEKLNAMLDTIQALAMKTGGSPEVIAESLRKLIVGIKEEGSPAVGKFFKSTPGLEEETEKLRDAHAEAYLHAQGLTDASQANTAQASEYHRLQREPISEFMVEESKRKGATGVLEEIKAILERSAPKAIMAEAETIHPEKKLAALWEEVSVAFGAKLKPAIDDFVNMLIAAMPTVKTSVQVIGDVFQITVGTLKAFGDVIYNTGVLLNNITSLGGLLPGVFDQIGIAGKQLADLWGQLAGHAMEDAEALSKHVDEVIEAKKKEKEEAEKVAEISEAAAKEKGDAFVEVTKAEVASAQEVAKIAEKSDASHEASQRRISYEQTQADLRSQAAAAARLAVIDRPRGATEELDKEYAAQAELAAKIINIKATAAEKINAADEDAANRIASIDEEQAIRNIDRATASAMDDSAEKSATLAKLNAEDAAAQVSRNDAMAEAREKEREADMDAANAIIDAQEAAAEKVIGAQEAAALANLEKMKGPYAEEEAPAGPETFTKWAKGGGVIEGSADKKAREERNAAVSAANREWKEQQRILIEHEFEEKKRIIEDQLERQRPTEIGLKRTHILQQEEHVKAIEAEKGRTEADIDFAKAHEKLLLPQEPRKEATGKADISRQVVANVLTKIWDSINIGNSHFESVFMTDS